MIKRNNYKKILFCLLIAISIILFRIKLIKKHMKEEDTYKYPASVINSNGPNYEYSDVSYNILYNTVMVPINETFTGIFGEQYTRDTDQ